MDVSGAPGVRWEEREKLEDAVTASSRRMRDMLCVQGRGKRKKRNRVARNWFLKTYYFNSVISSELTRDSIMSEFVVGEDGGRAEEYDSSEDIDSDEAFNSADEAMFGAFFKVRRNAL